MLIRNDRQYLFFIKNEIKSRKFKNTGKNKETTSLSLCFFPVFLLLLPHIYQQQIRIRNAKHMLVNEIPIVQLASHIGVVDQSHFTKVFKKMMGITPGEYISNRLGNVGTGKRRDRDVVSET